MTILASSLALANADYTWRTKAICRDTDPDLFFPIGTTGLALTQISRAKEVCGECPVVPIGKNRSGSVSRQMAWVRQV